jgi:hypothetical protein
MPKVSPIQSNFNGGEFSSYVHGRVEMDRYKSALSKCENYIPLIQGGLTRRSGTMFVAEVKDSSKKVRLEEFEFSTTQAYVIEFGNLYVRFYKDNGQILSLGVPYEVATPYLEAHLFELKFTQSADILYIVHPLYAPRKLTRTGHTAWTLTTISFVDGPYLSTNTTSIGLYPVAATGTTTLSAGPAQSVVSAANNGSGLIRVEATAHGFSTGDFISIADVTGTTEANGSWTITVIDANHFDLQGSTFVHAYVSLGAIYPGLFRSTDVGRHIRLKEGSVWGWGKITAFISYGQVTFQIVSTLTNTNPKTTWRFGVWSETTGYPAAVVFHEDRLTFGGATNYPGRLDGSKSSDYENFAPTDLDGTVKDNNAVSFSLNANDVNVLRWMTSDEKGLGVGTVGGEWVVRPSSQSEALSPTNITAKRATSYGSANVQPVQSGKATIFVQRSGKKLREFTYFYDVDGFRANDVTVLSEHITGGGIVQLAYQREPQSIIWCVRSDGALAAMTYERDLDSVSVGWSRHILGGTSDSAASDAVVESVAVIPSPDGTRSDVWVVVKRYINGATKRYVEYITRFFDESVDPQDAFFVDCGLTYDQPKTVTNATKTNPVVITSTAHGFSNGDKVQFLAINGMTQLNGTTPTIANKTANTFELSGIDGTSYGTYISGGEVRKLVSTISGLSHLEGESVSVLADSAVQPNKTISSGAITLDPPAATVQIGYGYNSDAQMLRIDAGSEDGTSIGKKRRIGKVAFLLLRSLGLKFGMSFDELDEITFRTAHDAMTRAPALFSGIISENYSAPYDFDNQICWRQDQPLPSTILAVMPQMETRDPG